MKKEDFETNLSSKMVVLFICMFAFFLMTIYYTEYSTEKVIEEIQKNKIEIIDHIEQRYHIDSLHRVHLENCAFINKNDISVNRRGYLYDAYSKKY